MAYKRISPIPVAEGGTGQITLTDSSVLVGNVAAGITQLAVGTNGQVLIGATGADPAFATLTSSDSSVSFTIGANSLSLQVAGGTTVGKTITGDAGGALSPTAGNWNILGTAAQGISTSGAASTLTLTIANATTAQKGVLTLATNAEAIAGADTTKAVTSDDLKAKLGTQTNHGVLVGAGTAAAVTALAVGTNGQILIGSTGADPVFATVGAGTGISLTTGAGSLTINATGGGLTWANTTVNASIVASNGYIANKAGRLDMTLPASPTLGDVFEITNINTAVGWRIVQNANQQIRLGTSTTTVGVGGYIEATQLGDSSYLVCTVGGASARWQVLKSMGNITVV